MDEFPVRCQVCGSDLDTLLEGWRHLEEHEAASQETRAALARAADELCQAAAAERAEVVAEAAETGGQVITWRRPAVL